jgi:hypothetical protein
MRRRIKFPKDYILPKTRRTYFTREEMLEIIDCYLYYKPMFDEYVNNRKHYPEMDPTDFTALLYVYDIIDVNYPTNVIKIKEKYGITSYDVTKEKLDFLEIITVFTEIHRMARNDWYLEDYCIKKDIYYNLLCRLEEIKNEL